MSFGDVPPEVRAERLREAVALRVRADSPPDMVAAARAVREIIGWR